MTDVIQIASLDEKIKAGKCRLVVKKRLFRKPIVVLEHLKVVQDHRWNGFDYDLIHQRKWVEATVVRESKPQLEIQI